MLMRIGNNLLGTMVLVAAGSVSLAPYAASAERASGEVSAVTVRYADLDLNSAAGVAELYERIEHAARTACSHTAGAAPLREVLARRACYREALATAIGKAGSGALDALYRSANGRRRAS